MSNESNNASTGVFILGLFVFLGLSSLGYLLGDAVLEFKQLDRTVTVKGLSEREYPADIVVWPIKFTVASNNLEALYVEIETNSKQIVAFLAANDIADEEISVGSLAITDKSAQTYGGNPSPEFRYAAVQAVTVYSEDIDQVRKVMSNLSVLGKRGIAFSGDTYQTQTEYLFTRLNEVKPAMVEEATRNAREVAQKFAKDSNSTLGKIRSASQGQFSIRARDTNNPHIKKVRVVSTVKYHLSD